MKSNSTGSQTKDIEQNTNKHIRQYFNHFVFYGKNQNIKDLRTTMSLVLRLLSSLSLDS